LDLKLKILHLQSFLDKLPEVSTDKLVVKKKRFHPLGLFSEQIFGPVTDYTCQCGIKNDKEPNSVCEKCGVKYTVNAVRRTNMAKIKLPYKVLHPVVYLSMNKRNTKLSKIFKEILSGRYVYRKIDGKYEKTDETYMLITDYYDLIENLVKDIQPVLYDSLVKNCESIFVDSLLVIPPKLRPIIQTNKDITVDIITSKYRQILNKIVQLETVPNRDKLLFYQYDTINELSKSVYDLYELFFDSINGSKNKIIRKYLLGKRIDFSGRTVIITDPYLKFDEVGVSSYILAELFKPEIIKKLVEKGLTTTSQEGNELINKYQKNLVDIYDIIKETCDGHIVILNRQPTLHRMGMFAFRVKTKKSKTLHLHPLTCDPYNADFDGDQMAIYRPLTEDAVNECLEKMLPSKNLLSISNHKLNFKTSQSIVFGIYTLTKEDDKYDFQIVKDIDGVMTTEGRKMFNDILPDDFPYINKTIAKKELNDILHELSLHKEYDTPDIMDKIKELGFRIATEYPIDVSLDNYYVPEVTYEYKKNNIYVNSEPYKNVQNEQKDVERLWTKFPLHELIDSSTRGSKIQAKQLFYSRGHISNFKGQFIDEPIINNLVDGLEPKEFFNSCYGTRKGLIDTADNTASSGFLTRQLIYLCSSIELDYDLEDCGSTDGITVKIKDHSDYEKYYGRYVIDKDGVRLINENDIGNTITIRSPIRCKGDKICKTCYGKLHELVNSRYIGIIAAQAIGEINTQNVLRTFHTSGAAEVKDNSTTQSDIVSDMDKVKKAFNGSLSSPYEMLNVLQTVYWSYSNIQSIHLELLVSQMIWYIDDENYVLWRKMDVDKIPTIQSRLRSIRFTSKLLSFIFSKGGVSLIDVLTETTTTENILIKFLFNEI